MSEEQKVQDETLEQATGQDTAEEQGADDALEQAQAEVAELKDQMLRIQAEMQNVRRRAELDVEKAHKFALEKFANEMLTTVDNLERGLAAAPEEEATQAIREGMEMTLTALLASLQRFNVEPVDPAGQTFNPELHQAITMIENPSLAPNTVMDVMQKGYTLNGRLLRPAMVVVSKGGAQIDEQA
ncbi:nucleotide exchange factor GrpE [Thalassolituus sp.]|jgi:molecular chaperone GrpE|uniref:nucleotide exchange factor GrpE n=1 Tax=Thalassolituus sp. TaxID=2030822 RepID=UPI0035117FFB